jgi:hypothetical protein
LKYDTLTQTHKTCPCCSMNQVYGCDRTCHYPSSFGITDVLSIDASSGAGSLPP